MTGRQHTVTRRAVLGGGLAALAAAALPRTAAGAATRAVPPVAEAQAGTVWTWGSNGYGECGRGSVTGPLLAPGPIPGLSGITAIGYGDASGYAIDGDGVVWSWGGGDPAVLGRTTGTAVQPGHVPGLDGVTAVQASYYHALALRADGTVWSWGENQWGQLGQGSMSQQARPLPGQVVDLPPAVAIAVGELCSFAVTATGQVFAWGNNESGTLGFGGTGGATIATPLQVAGIDTAVGIAAGFEHVLTLLADGSLLAWGDNLYGQLGRGTKTNPSGNPKPVHGDLRFTAVAATDASSYAITTTGQIAQWGFLREDTSTMQDVDGLQPAVVANLHAITSLSSNHYEAGSTIFALRHDGAAFATGDNTGRQFGRPAPVGGTTNWWRIPIPTARAIAGTAESGIALI